MPPRKALVTLAALSVSILGLSVPVSDAAAAPAKPAGCPADASYVADHPSSAWVGDPARKVTGVGPMTLAIATSTSDTITGVVGGTSGFSISGVIFAAKQDINYSISKAVTAGTTFTGTYIVPAGRHAWLQWGSWGYHYNWHYGSYAGSCVYRVTKSGTATSPTLSGKGFSHGLS